MKHFHQQPLAAAMGNLMAERMSSDPSIKEVDVVTCVPIHWRRRLSRGMNSPELMCEQLAQKLRIPGDPHALTCRRKASKQSMLPPERRHSNVRHAFRVSPGYVLRDLHVMLVDDVVTTGATIREVARTLRA